MCAGAIFFFQIDSFASVFACNRLVDKIKAFVKWIRGWKKKSSKEKYHMDVPYNEIPLEVNS